LIRRSSRRASDSAKLARREWEEWEGVPLTARPSAIRAGAARFGGYRRCPVRRGSREAIPARSGPFPWGKLHSTETVQRDVEGRVVETVEVGGSSHPKKARFEYESGKLVREITSWGEDTPTTTRYVWDEGGRIKGWSNDGGDQTSFEYECREAVSPGSKPRSANWRSAAVPLIVRPSRTMVVGCQRLPVETTLVLPTDLAPGATVNLVARVTSLENCQNTNTLTVPIVVK
jgi:YD repeat-containing protein